MRLASSKAGIKGSLPNYTPSGYAYKGVETSPGEITVNFHSNSDQRSFEVKQKVSGWNSETLKSNYVAASSQPYQSQQENGKTLFIYNNGSSATWVDGGVWYQIEGQNNLSSDQLVKIANSL